MNSVQQMGNGMNSVQQMGNGMNSVQQMGNGMNSVQQMGNGINSVLPSTRKHMTKQNSRGRRIVTLLAGVIVIYLATAYLILPAVWKRYEHRHPALDDLPGITLTANGIPGDPVNVALIGTKADLVKAMLAARWYPADPLSLKSSLE